MLGVLLLSGSAARAQEATTTPATSTISVADLQALYDSLLQRVALLQRLLDLQQQVAALEAQLAALQATVASSIPPTPQISGTAPAGTTAPDKGPNPIQAPHVTKTISVKVVDDTHVEILNDTGVAVRVKGLGVKGTLERAKIGNFDYAASFDANGQTFNLFACNGLGSLGTTSMPGDGGFDPCKRRDGNQPRNELQPGEKMILHVEGGTDITYQAGTIVEVATGDDVTY